MDGYLDDVVNVSGGRGLDALAASTVGAHYMISLAVIVALVIIIVVLLWKKNEGFSANSTMKYQQVGLSGSENYTVERADAAPDRSQSAFAQQVQSAPGGSFTYDPTADPSNPNSLNYQILHSGDFNCDNRVAIGDDAWGWMAGVAAAPVAESSEGFKGGKATENKLSYLLKN
jgi:hypothetical protein